MTPDVWPYPYQLPPLTEPDGICAHCTRPVATNSHTLVHTEDRMATCLTLWRGRGTPHAELAKKVSHPSNVKNMTVPTTIEYD